MLTWASQRGRHLPNTVLVTATALMTCQLTSSACISSQTVRELLTMQGLHFISVSTVGMTYQNCHPSVPTVLPLAHWPITPTTSIVPHFTSAAQLYPETQLKLVTQKLGSYSSIPEGFGNLFQQGRFLCPYQLLILLPQTFFKFLELCHGLFMYMHSLCSV